MSDFKSPKSETADFDLVKRDDFSQWRCPVAINTDLVVQTSQETIKTLQNLRQSLLNCEFCLFFEKCELGEQLNNQVNQIIFEINEEWGW